MKNPDDLGFVGSFGAPTKSGFSMFGGAGVYPGHFSELPPNISGKLKVGYVGRMIWSKGVNVLVAARDILQGRSIDVEFGMYVTPDSANPRAIQTATLE